MIKTAVVLTAGDWLLTGPKGQVRLSLNQTLVIKFDKLLWENTGKYNLEKVVATKVR